MNPENHFIYYLKDMDESFTGWDFSYITETDRMRSSLLTWSYGSMAISLIQNAHALLDMGTGGGELLSMLRPLPSYVFATESYTPNYSIAKSRLEPFGVKVIKIEGDKNLPFSEAKFDLILNRHESYSSKEVRRIIQSEGIFFTQQVGGLDCVEINETLGTPSNSEFENWNLSNALKELKENHFEVLFSNEEFPVQRFYDVGALVYYLKAIPWQVPDFSVEKYKEQLNSIHKLIQSKGFFDVKQHRFLIKAKAL